MSAALIVFMGAMFASGTYLILQRSLTRIILGVAMLANAVNILILGIGARSGAAPIIGREGEFTDPLPQALVLTAIVIGFGIVAFLLALAWRGWTIEGNDVVEDDDEDKRVTSAKPLTGETEVPGDYQ